MREAWIQRQFAQAAAINAPVVFGCARPPLTLIVDLGADLFSRQWWRGAATLAALVLWALMLGPAMTPLPAGKPARPALAIQQQWDAIGRASCRERVYLCV